MKHKGLTKEDIICLCTDNNLNAIVPYIASILLGIKVAPLDPSLSKDDTKYLLNLVKPTIVFISSNARKLLKESLEEIKLKSELVTIDQNGFALFLEPNEKEDTFLPVETKNLQETSLIFFSSGTTGLPKGICLHQFGIMAASKLFL